MNNIELEKQIIELIPSQTIEDEIRKMDYKFTDL